MIILDNCSCGAKLSATGSGAEESHKAWLKSHQACRGGEDVSSAKMKAVLIEMAKSAWSLGLQGASYDDLSNNRKNRMTVEKAAGLITAEAYEEGKKDGRKEAIELMEKNGWSGQ